MSHIGDMFADLLTHRRIDGDAENNAIVDAFALALGDVFDRLGHVAFGDPEQGVRGEQILRDPAVAPLWALAHAALYTGAKLPTRLAEETDEQYVARARDASVYPLGIRRGTHEAIRRAIQSELTGTKAVYIADDFGTDYDLYVRTLIEETPDPARVERLLAGDFVSGGERGAIRAELILTYETSAAVAWAEATLTWGQIADGVTWSTATVEDVT